MSRKMVPVSDRFWPKVDLSGGPNACWTWTGSKNAAGYGKLGPGGRHRSAVYAHRLSYAIANNIIVPDSLDVCHSCDNPSCVNPKHLFLGTHSDNMRDCVAKGRHVSMLPDNPLGESAYRAKLRQCEVEEIRRLRSLGVTGMMLAKMFPVVCYQEIYRICSGERYSDGSPEQVTGV